MTHYQLDKNNRIRFSWEYRLFFNKSEIIRFSEITFFRIKNEFNHYRLGVTIKAKANSVERNKIKRSIREFFRQNSELLGSYDYNVVIPQQKAINPAYINKLKRCLNEQPILLIKK